jgi:putative Holliday junction resolvase
MRDGAPSAPQLHIAFDFGTRRIGIATGDSLTRTARALTTIAYQGALPWDAIGKLIADYRPHHLIVGLPCNMDGTPTSTTSAARAFAAQLEQRFRIPVTMVDEHLSSRAAEDELRHARASGLKKRRTVHADVDKVAAKLLLDQWYAHGVVPP